MALPRADTQGAVQALSKVRNSFKGIQDEDGPAPFETAALETDNNNVPGTERQLIDEDDETINLGILQKFKENVEKDVIVKAELIINKREGNLVDSDNAQ